MAINLGTQTGLPSAPRSETYPLTLYGEVNIVGIGAPGVTTIIHHNGAASNYWITGSASVLSWCLFATSAIPQSNGATLQILGSTDPIFFPAVPFQSYPIPVNAYSIVSGVEVPFPQIQFLCIDSPSGGANGVNLTGWIRLQGGK